MVAIFVLLMESVETFCKSDDFSRILFQFLFADYEKATIKARERQVEHSLRQKIGTVICSK